MKEFTVFTSTALPLKVDNIDTDQIIPARFLKAVTRDGFGEKLFNDWRYNADGTPKNDSVFADPRYKDAHVLLVNESFGTGSSREHAAWAIHDYGFRCVIGASFGDIFYNNSLKNGLLIVKLEKKEIEWLFHANEKDPNLEITIDLPQQLVSTSAGGHFNFEINPFRKTCIVKGVDDLGYLLALDDKIKEYEMKSF